eukprot:TRINITY_DN474_c0_g1_i2.p1 TRINITY_DN474_c0_g1~~TRINITY_DN474_c0_g1_i2.p1  ORF type:complete len:350 (-),score=65.81 TRINITY_DN474_c0_g1_i2:331-1380(-)
MEATTKNIILLMWDGIRPQEVFHGSDPLLYKDEKGITQTELLPFFWNEFVSNGLIYGSPSSSSLITCSNSTMISLPAYQSIMAGAEQPYCKGNDSGRIRVSTLQERLIDELDLPSGKVCSFASWSVMREAVSCKDDSHLINCGVQKYTQTSELDGADEKIVTIPPNVQKILSSVFEGKSFEEFNENQTTDLPPWKNARHDKYTFGLALQHLATHKPKFMFLSLNDSDELGHLGHYEKYLSTISTYDRYLSMLVEVLKSMEEYGKNTVIIVTTDHGRGLGEFWVDHGGKDSLESSRNVWLAAYGDSVKKLGVLGLEKAIKTHTHSDIRPTIEKLMGLKPVDGVILDEIVD